MLLAINVGSTELEHIPCMVRQVSTNKESKNELFVAFKTELSIKYFISQPCKTWVKIAMIIRSLTFLKSKNSFLKVS